MKNDWHLVAVLVLFLLATVETVNADTLFVATGEIDAFNSQGIGTNFTSNVANPTGLAFDADGNLFVACNGDTTVKKFTPTGSSSVFASGIANPWALTFDKAGNLYVSTPCATRATRATRQKAQASCTS